MNCSDVKRKIRDYLEDLHGEPDREQIRDHLAACSVCHGFAIQLGTYPSDLMRIAQAPVPFDFAEAYLTDPDIERDENFKIPKAAMGLGILAVSAVAFMISGPRVFEATKKISAKEEAPKTSDEEEPASLVMLRKIAEDLGAEVKKNEEMKAAQAVKLRPFHWHLKFQNFADEPIFLKKLEELKIRILFQNAHFLVIQPDQNQLAKLVEFLNAFKEPGIQSALSSIKNLPVRFEPVRISAVLESSKEASSAIHWHLQFTLPNRLAFLDWLRDQGYKLIYTEPEIWVIQIRSEQELALLNTQIQDTAGLIAEMGFKAPGNSVPGKVVIYVRD